jgi:DNA-binding NarL/FixJ family response regulator
MTADPGSHEARTPTKRLFIVDDSQVVRERIASLLSEVDHLEIVGEWDGADAVSSIRRLKPDVVILDLRLQLGNGFDILRDLKRESDHPIVIVLTNYPYPQYKRACLEAGADYFFDKTGEFGSILDVLQDLTGAIPDPIAREASSDDQTVGSGSGHAPVPGASEHALDRA